MQTQAVTFPMLGVTDCATHTEIYNEWRAREHRPALAIRSFSSSLDVRSARGDYAAGDEHRRREVFVIFPYCEQYRKKICLTRGTIFGR